MSPPSDIVPQFVSAARDYRLLIEGASAFSLHSFLQSAQRVLAGLYSLALQLPDPDPTTEDPLPNSMSNDEWRELYDRLGAYLGSSNLYWMVFDPIDHDDHESIRHTLADDLSDIYRDLKDATLEAGLEPSADTLWSVKFSFESHWGHHAVDAMMAIHSLLHGPHALGE